MCCANSVTPRTGEIIDFQTPEAFCLAIHTAASAYNVKSIKMQGSENLTGPDN